MVSKQNPRLHCTGPFAQYARHKGHRIAGEISHISKYCKFPMLCNMSLDFSLKEYILDAAPGRLSTLPCVDAFQPDKSNSPLYFCVLYLVVPLLNKEEIELECQSRDDFHYGNQSPGAGSHFHHSHLPGYWFLCARLNRRLILSLPK